MERFDQLRGEEYINEWPRYSPQDLRRREATLIAAKLAVGAAMTAPVAGGVPQAEAHLVYGQEEMEKVARKMEELAHTNKKWQRQFLSEAVMIRETDVIVFLGDYRAHETPLDANCGMCGGAAGCSYFYTRRETNKGLVDVTDRRSETPIKGPLCGARVDDLGYVMGSAIWMAQTLLVDARPFMSVGLAGQKLGYCPNSGIVVGIPDGHPLEEPLSGRADRLPPGQHGQDGRQHPEELRRDPADRFRYPLRLPQAVPQSEEGGVTWPG